MLDMQQVNQALKEAFTLELRDIKDLPVDLARGYINWVRGLVGQASQQLAQQTSSAQQGSQGQGRPQGGEEQMQEAS